MGAHNRWEHFEHGADVGVRGIGATREAAFEQAAMAMTAAVANLGAVAARDAVDISCAAPDDELLLVDWLNAIIYEMATRHMLFSRFEVSFDGGRLQARALGRAFSSRRSRPFRGSQGGDLHVPPRGTRTDGRLGRAVRGGRLAGGAA